MTERTALYRHWDSEGNLLYVGISLKPFQRLEQHQHGSHWACDIAKITLEYFSTRTEAESAERIAIKSESPKHNIVHAADNDNARTLRTSATPVEFPRPSQIDDHVYPHATRRGSRGMNPEDIVAEATVEPIRTPRGVLYRVTEGMVLASLDRMAAEGRIVRCHDAIYPATANGYVHPLMVRRYIAETFGDDQVDDAA